MKKYYEFGGFEGSGGQPSQELLKREFVHFISDTISLLTGDPDFVAKIRQVEEKPFTTEVINTIRGFNIKQIDKLKHSLSNLNTISVQRIDPEND